LELELLNGLWKAKTVVLNVGDLLRRFSHITTLGTCFRGKNRSSSKIA
jgi:hypothetical protein